MSVSDVFGEGGPIETLQILLLAASAAMLSLTAVRGPRAGSALVAVMAVGLAVAALREYDTEAVRGLPAYLASRTARWHLVSLFGLVALALAVSGRRIPWRDHWRGARGVLPFLLAGAGLALLGGEVENLTASKPSQWTAYLIGEEVLELAGYSLAALAAIGHLTGRNAWSWVSDLILGCRPSPSETPGSGHKRL